MGNALKISLRTRDEILSHHQRMKTLSVCSVVYCIERSLEKEIKRWEKNKSFKTRYRSDWESLRFRSIGKNIPFRVDAQMVFLLPFMRLNIESLIWQVVFHVDSEIGKTFLMRSLMLFFQFHLKLLGLF